MSRLPPELPHAFVWRSMPAKGSFYPSARDAPLLDAAADDNDAELNGDGDESPVAQRASGRHRAQRPPLPPEPSEHAPLCSWGRCAALALVLLLLALLSAPIILVVMTRMPYKERIASGVPAVASLFGLFCVCASWVAWPTLRSVFFGHITCLAVATAWYAVGVLFVAALPDGTARCVAVKLTAAGWVASWMWSWPVTLDFLLLVRFHMRGNTGARYWLSRGSQLVWLLAAAVSLPLIRSDAYTVEDPIAVCALPTRPAAWPPYAITAAFGVTALFNGAVHLSTLFGRAAEDMPGVVRQRHQRRALCLCVCFCVLQPPTAALFAFNYFASDEAAAASNVTLPPQVISVWSAQAGASWQGLLLGLAFAAWADLGMGVRRVVRCCSRSEEVPVLGHEDSRFVHFDPVVADPDDFLLRPDREELDQNSPSIVCLTLPLATMLTVMVTALTLHW